MCMRRGGAMLRRRGVASLDCRVVGADERWLQWCLSDDKASARLQRVKQRWCSQCSSTSATSRSCDSRGIGPRRAGCNATDDGLPKCSVSRQVAPTYHFRGVYHRKRDRYLSQRRRAGRKTGLAPKSLPGGSSFRDRRVILRSPCGI